MKIEFNKQSLCAWVADRIEKRKIHRCTDPRNGFTHAEAGEIEALQDIKHLVELFGEDFVEHGRLVISKKVASKQPHYYPIQDKANGDSWWITGYVATMKEFGIS